MIRQVSVTSPSGSISLPPQLVDQRSAPARWRLTVDQLRLSLATRSAAKLMRAGGNASCAKVTARFEVAEQDAAPEQICAGGGLGRVVLAVVNRGVF